MENKMRWEKDRIFPAFTLSEGELDAVRSLSLTRDEAVTVASLQGIVNRRLVRILILDERADEGCETWPQTLGLKYRIADKYELLDKYIGEAAGVVLYSEEKSCHYVNLASSVASVLSALPMTRELYDALLKKGYRLEVLCDLCSLELTDTKDIYNYFYDNYWKKNTKRLLISQNPHIPLYLRDIAAASGAATVFLENRNNEERAVYERFLSDMTPGESIVIGWYTEERSGITTATSLGLSTVPADFFSNFTVYALDKPINKPKLKKEPPLENKIYAALFVSDGDNIQYNEHFMRKFWDRTAKERGKTCINWTISPALADAAPDMMNYFYDTATEKDFFVSGPSGLGYAMPVNTLDEEIAAKNYVKDDRLFSEYVKLSNRYFEKAGLRSVTVWDNLTDNQRDIYTKYATNLLGITVQLFTDDREKISSFNGGMPIKQLTPCYTTTVEHMKSVLSREVASWDRKSPKFIASQFSVWGKISVSDIAEIEEEMKALSGGAFEFVSADDFFRLMKKQREG